MRVGVHVGPFWVSGRVGGRRRARPGTAGMLLLAPFALMFMFWPGLAWGAAGGSDGAGGFLVCLPWWAALAGVAIWRRWRRRRE